MTENGVIYALHAGDDRLRYVGLTRKTAHFRTTVHKANARRGEELPVYRWMRSVGVDLITYSVLEICPVADLPERERFWIATLKQEGVFLFNATSGGEGVRDLTPESRARLSASKSGSNHPNWGKPAYIAGRKMPSPGIATREKLSISSKAAWAKRKLETPIGGSYYGKSHCPHGHEYTPENTGFGTQAAGYPVRFCKACRKAYKLRIRGAGRKVTEVFDDDESAARQD